ncbi:MAG: hypothetical protein JKY96_08975 [Phycisphaerales bacterium]|nr:hypothetical protein [Phycisphaerales bacterium]
MKPTQHDTFWMLYEQKVRQPIERACRSASRKRTDSSMDVDDMIAWIDTRVWRMLQTDAYPTFHDDPTPEQAIQRLVDHCTTLARWSYLALCRKHFRRLNQRTEYLGGMSRAERLSMVSSNDTKIEGREELAAALGSLRKSLSDKEKQKMAASYIHKEDRHRVALVLGATSRQDDRAISQTLSGVVKENTVQQMRSRSRKRALEILNGASKLPLYGIIAFLGLLVSVSATPAQAGEQTGGRKGSRSIEIDQTIVSINQAIIPGEQTGGRGPKR